MSGPGPKTAPQAAPAAADLTSPSLYLTRELAQLEFQFRVLAQARDPAVPLLERVRFLCITLSNLDEFFEVRIPALQQPSLAGVATGPDGLSPAKILARIRARVLPLQEMLHATWQDGLLPALASEGVLFPSPETWNCAERAWLQEWFRREVLPVVTPVRLDAAHPFPRILNKSLNLAVRLEGRDAYGREGNLAVVRAPRSLPRLLRLPAGTGTGERFVFLSTLLPAFIDELFAGLAVTGAWQFRVTRSGMLAVDEAEGEDIARALKAELEARGHARAVRLEVSAACPDAVTSALLGAFDLGRSALYRSPGPVNLGRAEALLELLDRPELRYPPFRPRPLPAHLLEGGLLAAIRQRDLLLHHPYESFDPVLELVREASEDPDVLAIKQTLYRMGRKSPLAEHLMAAARRGKDITVVVELRARFDEEHNLHLSDRLQEAGVQVVHGVPGFKTHAKMLLIVRREADGLRRYVHLSTGNYHQGNASQYTDLALLTAHPGLGEDVHRLFQQLSGLAPGLRPGHLLHAPLTLHQGILERIGREAAHAAAGRPAHIIARMNALNEPQVIRALYKASQAGVEIDLIVRGACTLRPGVPGVSDRIRVRSIVGRFLEHSRVYWFANDGAPELFCASADWLERNLLRRIETCFPILDPVLADRVRSEALDNYLLDNTQAWLLQPDGSYQRLQPGDERPHSAQQTLIGTYSA